MTTHPAHTAFTKSGDLVIHATLYADLPAERIASLSLYELPYELAGHQYGVKANQKARPRAVLRPPRGPRNHGHRIAFGLPQSLKTNRPPPPAGPAHL